MFIFKLNIPITIAGKKDAAASPKASATVAATKLGGLIPKYPTSITARKEEIQLQLILVFLTLGCIIPLIKSYEIDEEITSKRPAQLTKQRKCPTQVQLPVW